MVKDPSGPTVYKCVARRRAPMASSPRILNRYPRHRPDAEVMQKAPVAVHHRSACSGVKALRNTSDARRQAAKLCYRFGPLTPSARSANLIAGDGTKNGPSRSEQRTATNQKQPLDTKSPIQVRIRFPPAASPLRTRPVWNDSTYFRQLVVGKIGESVQTQWHEHGSSGGREAPSG
jgi:hypothetical protein